MNPDVPLRIKALKKWRDKKAKTLGIEPGILINKSVMSVLATEKPTSKRSLMAIAVLKKWQIQEFGHDILAVFNHVK